MIEPHHFHDLVRRARADDPQAREQLLEAVRPYLAELARDFADPGHPEESVSDLVQDASVRVWQKLGQFQGAGDDQQTLAMFRAWAGQIVRNLGVSAQRHRNAQRRHPQGKMINLAAPNPQESSSGGEGIDVAGREASPSSNACKD